MVGTPMQLTMAQQCVIMDNLEIFRKNGFEFDIDPVCGSNIIVLSDAHERFADGRVTSRPCQAAHNAIQQGYHLWF